MKINLMQTDYSKLPIEEANKEFITACIQNNLEGVIKLLTDSRLEPHINEEKLCMGFNWACGDKFNEILEYLIFEYNIPNYPLMAAHLELPDNAGIKNMFVIRELNQELKTELNMNPQDKCKLKL